MICIITIINQKNEYMYYFIVMELCDGSLLEWLQKEHSLQEYKDMLIYIIEGLMRLRLDLGISMNDLAPRNILYKNTGDGTIFLISDFGLSSYVKDEDPEKWTTDINFFFDNLEENILDCPKVIRDFVTHVTIPKEENYIFNRSGINLPPLGHLSQNPFESNFARPTIVNQIPYGLNFNIPQIRERPSLINQIPNESNYNTQNIYNSPFNVTKSQLPKQKNIKPDNVYTFIENYTGLESRAFYESLIRKIKSLI